MFANFILTKFWGDPFFKMPKIENPKNNVFVILEICLNHNFEFLLG